MDAKIEFVWSDIVFGYIYPDKMNLKIKEYEIFRAFYCGVCKSIGKRHGQIPRLTLNYDSVFLSVLLSALSEEELVITQKRCLLHPLKKRNIIKNNKIIDYISDFNVILAYYKMEDNWKDDKSVLSLGAFNVLKSTYRRLENKNIGKCGIIKGRLQELSRLEKTKCDSMDKTSEVFAKLMEEIFVFSPVCENENTRKALECIGYNVGKWVYILDAYDDLNKDIEKNSYNPLIYQFKINAENFEEVICQVRERVNFNLTFCLNSISKAFELLGIKHNKGLLENIIYMGMLKKTENILYARSCKKVEESI